ncbi:putative N-acetylglucosamine kinase [Neoasaia chiangmaiensis NBRC 101099]|uniref:Uncharacterized protein n=1 Tax=Neoasaia chiangmaiensis TaxID=320497 RepID=A0A1U9KP61_9PROT|nr:BadF/BadG/BcrA/BcrD ATPase family protein [Neoasaia chiangmaiensis]AQS87519.1 hypothetical protein A0U93_05730 [Neoasaia chiangmaiensis]GBR42423.1 putative N-acetylglucosamine kinase [Neoasaia chiangmaiensis NBRC 101099]GEN16316.1 hypothetical protein NCH01_27470 [Neoasaia chiangmaiensis]
MTEFLVGFDGGGTGTRVRVTTLAGELVGQGSGGGANIAVEPVLAWRSLRQAFAPLRAELPASARLWCAAGLAGTEAADARGRFLSARPDDMPEMALVTDAHTSCLGAHGGADGAIVAIGTGSVGFALSHDPNGTRLTRRVGGWGFPQGDEGSGAWIGRQAVSAMLQAHDERIQPDALTEGVRQALAAEGDPMAWAIGRRAAEFAALAPLVVSSAARGSGHAQAIMRAAAAEIEAHATALLKPAAFASLPLCLLGGLGPVLEPYLSVRWQHLLRPPCGDSVDGALLLARLHRTTSMEQSEGQPT